MLNRLHHRLVLGLASLSFALLQSAPVWACSCYTEEQSLVTVPADGEVNVPLNVVPWVTGQRGVQLVDPDGNVVDIVVRAQPGRDGQCVHTKELVPNAPLLPNTTYRLVFAENGTAEREQVEVSFTTGKSELNSTVWDEIEMRSQAFDAQAHKNSCVYTKYQACIDAGLGEQLIDVRVVTTSGNERVRHVDFGKNLHNIELQSSDECIEVRIRDLAGRTSPPARSCFTLSDVPVLPVGDILTIYPDCNDVWDLPQGVDSEPDASDTSVTVYDAAVPDNDAQPPNKTDAQSTAPQEAPPGERDAQSAAPDAQRPTSDEAPDAQASYDDAAVAVSEEQPLDDAASRSRSDGGESDHRPPRRRETSRGCAIAPTEGTGSVAMVLSVLATCFGLMRRRRLGTRDAQRKELAMT